MASFEGWARFVHPDDVARIRADTAIAAAKHDDRLAYRYRFRPTSRSEWRLIEGIALCWYDADGKLSRMTGVALDITSSAASREALARSEDQLRSVIATLPDAVLVIDALGTIQSLNGVAESLFEDEATHIIGQDIGMLIPAAFAAGKGRVPGTDLTQAARSMIGQTHSLKAQRPDGTIFPVELNVGEAVGGDASIFTCFVRNISERVEAAQRLDEIRTQYLRTARLNAMGTVAAGLAHELNQPLAAGANYLSASTLLLNQGRSTEEIAALVAEARKQIKLAGDIIRRLRGFLTQGDQHIERLAFAELIEEAVALALAGRDRTTITVTFASAHQPDLFADRVQVLQILVNLLRNAAEAMAHQQHRAITVTTRRQGRHILVSLADNGPGFEAAVLDAMEGAVVSTKGSEGMGFGLSICRRIVDEWDGTLSIANLPQGGAEVTFSVPAFDVASGADLTAQQH